MVDDSKDYSLRQLAAKLAAKLAARRPFSGRYSKFDMHGGRTPVTPHQNAPNRRTPRLKVSAPAVHEVLGVTQGSIKSDMLHTSDSFLS
jgi:hypothetical protein